MDLDEIPPSDQHRGSRSELCTFLGVELHLGAVARSVLRDDRFSTYDRQLIQYEGSDGDTVPAYLFVPHGDGPYPAVLVHHQHNGERHLGKSEIAGLDGDPYQAFGPALATRGYIVLAPDSVCFEDRRRNKTGTAPADDDDDWLQHFNEMTYRLARGDTLMRKVLEDAGIALSLLQQLPAVDRKRLGVLGHSYGGNTTLFQAAIDERVAFACSSGAACTYKRKMKDEIPFEFALAIPGISAFTDIEYLVAMTAPRTLLLVSAEGDKYSRDADFITSFAKPSFEQLGAEAALQHRRYPDGHALTQERFDFIVEWFASLATSAIA